MSLEREFYVVADFRHAPDPVDEFLDAVLGTAGGGNLVLGFGHGPKVKGQDRPWAARAFKWPEQREEARREIDARQRQRWDAYFSPAPFSTRTARRGKSQAVWALSFELDEAPADPELLDKLDAVLVESGTPEHLHVYVLLAEPVDSATSDRLAEVIAKAVAKPGRGVILKWEDNAILRVPGTWNFKSYWADGAPRRVRLVKAEAKRWSLDELEALSASLTPADDSANDDDEGDVPGYQGDPWKRLPDSVRAALDRDECGEGTGRGMRHHALVRACKDARFSFARTLAIVSEFPPSREKYGRALEKNVRSSWKAKAGTTTPSSNKKERGETGKQPCRAVVPVRQTSWTLDDLMVQEFPELTWAVDGLIPEGLTLLVAAPKIGKSFLTMCVALALVYNRPALGSLKVDPGEVLVIPLDDPSPRRMQDRLQKITAAMLGKRRHQLYLEMDWPTLAEGGGERLDEWLEEHPNCRMVVIDTLSRLRDEESRKSADPGKPDEKAMAEFKRIADKHRVAIIGTHHDRKAEGDDFVDMVSGNKKLTGGADTIIYLKRARGQGHTVAKITGRDVEERELALSFDHPMWVVLDETPAELNMGDLRRSIIDHLREHGEATPTELAEALGQNYNTVNQRLFQMLKAGDVSQPGGKRTPYQVPRA